VTSLEVVLIHNNNVERLNAMRNVLSTLKASVPAAVELSFAKEVSWQPERLSSRIMDRLGWALANSRTQSLLALAKKSPSKFHTLLANLVGVSSFIVYLGNEIRDALKKRDFSTRHRQVSRKHSVAWMAFDQASNADWLLVLEDDALFTEVGQREFWRIFADADGLSKDAPTFLLASEGLALEVLKVEEQAFEVFSPYVKSPPFPFTNTAAAYLINKSLARYFVSSLELQPSLAANTIDFLINNLLLRLYLDRQGLTVVCHHAVNPPFQNASINGRYSSLISG